MFVVEADQFASPCAPEAKPRVTTQDTQPLLSVAGLTDKPGATQCHDTSCTFPGPVNLKFALAGHTVLRMRMVTRTLCPGNKVPLDGTKVTPSMPLLVADQSRGN